MTSPPWGGRRRNRSSRSLGLTLDLRCSCQWRRRGDISNVSRGAGLVDVEFAAARVSASPGCPSPELAASVSETDLVNTMSAHQIEVVPLRVAGRRRWPLSGPSRRCRDDSHRRPRRASMLTAIPMLRSSCTRFIGWYRRSGPDADAGARMMLAVGAADGDTEHWCSSSIDQLALVPLAASAT